MRPEEIIELLRQHENELRARGVAHAALFGSRARGDYRPDSDADIMVEIEPEAHISVWDYVGIVRSIEGALSPLRVDVSDRGAQKAHVKPSAERDAIYAF